jgi:hypothetical protein
MISLEYPLACILPRYSSMSELMHVLDKLGI